MKYCNGQILSQNDHCHILDQRMLDSFQTRKEFVIAVRFIKECTQSNFLQKDFYQPTMLHLN